MSKFGYEENKADEFSILLNSIRGFCRSSNERMRWVNLKQSAFKIDFIFLSFGVIGFVLKHHFILNYSVAKFDK